MECVTFEEFKEKLLSDKYQALAFFVDDLCFHEIAHRPQTNEVAVCSGMIADAIDSFTVAYPELSKEALLDYEYKMPADEFFSVAKKIIDYFYAGQEWIILYKDEQNHVHVEPYKLTPEQYDAVKDWYKSNI